MSDSIRAKKQSLRFFYCVAMIAFFAMASSFSVIAAPGVLAERSLNLATTVKPNILIMVDDSSTMGELILITKEAQEEHGISINGTDSVQFYFANSNVSLWQLCPAFNALAYNPNVKYKAPISYPGKDHVNLHTDPGIHNNLLLHMYIRWNDEDGDGLYDKGECGPGIQAYTSNSSELMRSGDEHCGKLHCEQVAKLPFDSSTASADQPYNTRQNYATWYYLYRSKLRVAKMSIVDFLHDTNLHRVGVASIHKFNGAIIKDMEDNPDGTMNTNKASLIRLVEDMSPRSYTHTTPLRRALSNAGLYFEENGSPDPNMFGARSAKHIESSVLHEKTPILNHENGGQCQQNFMLMFSDGVRSGHLNHLQWNRHDRNGNRWGFIDNIDGRYGGDGDYSGDGDGDLTHGVYYDRHLNGLSDIAMYNFIYDLAPSLPDSLSVELHGQTITHQHLVFFGIGYGIEGTLDRDPIMDPPELNFWNNDDQVGFEALVDDYRHAAFNGRGGYYSVTDADDWASALDNISYEINSRTANTGADTTYDGYELATDDISYHTTFKNIGWWGDIQAYAFNTETNAFQTVVWSADNKMRLRGNTRHIDRNIITYNGYKGIPFTFPDDYLSAMAGTDRDALHPVQVADLLNNAPHLTPEREIDSSTSENVDRNKLYGKVMVDYLRGSNQYDGATLSGETVSVEDGNISFENIDSHVFRDREEHYIGALIHSRPRFVGAPNNNYADDIELGHPYSDFATHETHKNRRPMLYVGGNDGMLHGFYANGESAGEEVFSYIPKIVSDPDNGGKGLHEIAPGGLEGLSYLEGLPYVDGQLAIDDVFVDRWRTYLVGGLRAGGRGIYVLDVTNPDNSQAQAQNYPKLSDAEAEANADDIVIFEFTHPDMGHVYGKPVIAKMNNGRWAAIVANGYNSSGSGLGSAKAALFIVYLDAPTEPHGDDSDGDGIMNNGHADYTIIQTGENGWHHCANENEECSLTEAAQIRYYSSTEGAYVIEERTEDFICNTDTFDDLGGIKTCEYSDNNGLSQPRVIDVDGNGTADRIYAGDLHGNMWIFDVSATGSDNAQDWGLHNSNNKPFYTACSTDLVSGVCPRDHRQPITSAPLVTNHPTQKRTETAPNHLVFFGTGQYITESDITSNDEQSFYGIWDRGSSTFDLNKKNLTARQIINETIDDVKTGKRTIEDATVIYSQGLYGWYFESLPDAKERVVLEPLLLDDTIVFTTLIPGSDEECRSTSGSGYIMIVDALTGGNPSINLFGKTDDKNIAGDNLDSLIVGVSITRGRDGIKINTRRDDNRIKEDIVGSDDDIRADSLYRNKGRKSWSILH